MKVMWSNRKYNEAVRLADEIIKEVKSFNISSEWSPVFKAFCVFLFMCRAETKYYTRIQLAFKHRISFSECSKFVYNWKRYNRYDRKQFYLDLTDDELHNVVELTLFCMLGAGQVECVQADKEDNSTQELSETLQEIEKRQKERDSGPYQFMRAI